MRELAPQPQEPRPQAQPPAMGRESSRASRSGADWPATETIAEVRTLSAVWPKSHWEPSEAADMGRSWVKRSLQVRQ